MEWIRRCVEMLLGLGLVKAFAGCDTVPLVLEKFSESELLTQLGAILAVFVIGAGIRDMVRALWRWLKSMGPIL